MTFTLSGHDFKYELEKVCRLFMPFEKFNFTDGGDKRDGVFTGLEKREDGTVLTVAVNTALGRAEKCETVENGGDDYDRICELTLARLLYYCLTELTGYTPEWGIVTGIRPVRLLERYIGKYGGEAKARLRSDMLISDEKLALTEKCLESESEIIARSAPYDYSLYLSVPFCPSRCSYCSFVSHSVEQAKKLIPDYVERLCDEMKTAAQTAERLGLHLKTVYIGGGTPTVLSAEQLERVMSAAAELFPIKCADEYTVEAGRPDTVTPEKLAVIKKYGATRISINPQTMNDEVLKAIGRRHTAEQMRAAFYMAREAGFGNINTDLIAGLTSDTLDSFKRTVDEMIMLSPENVTVHTLSLKRASNMTKASMFYGTDEGRQAAKRLDYASKNLENAGIYPYYMYRQGKTVGNLENVGYAKKGYEGLYNVYIMDETHTVIACGASAVTKLRAPYGEQIERIFNYKYPYEYLTRFDELEKRKQAIAEFYMKYGKGE